MAYAFAPSKPTDNPITATTGGQPIEWLLLGKDGFNSAGVGKWVSLEGVQWKSFLLRRHDSPHNAALGAASVEIHFANELDPVDPDANTKFIVGATLNSGAPSFTYEPPWRYVRAELKVAGSGLLQVDAHGIGI